MNKLQKNAWIDLIAVAAAICFAGLIFCSLTKSNAHGVIHILIILIVGPTTGLIMGTYQHKREKCYDERERKIKALARNWAMGVHVCFLMAVCFIPFFLLGGKNSIPVYFLPFILLSSLFVGQFTESMVILIRFMLEDDDAE